MISTPRNAINPSKSPRFTHRLQLQHQLPLSSKGAGSPAPIAPALPETVLHTNLHKLVNQHGPFPTGSAILGICPDRAPLILDLSDPEPGALLVSSEQTGKQTSLLRAILASTILLNKPDQLAIHVIAGIPRRYDDFFPSEHVRQLLSADDPAISSAILELLPENGLQLGHRQRAQITILAVDSLQDLTDHLDRQAYAALCWLARHGPRLRIWLMAAQPAGHLDEVDELLLSAFRTRLVDNTQASSRADFSITLDDETIPFRVCDLGK